MNQYGERTRRKKKKDKKASKREKLITHACQNRNSERKGIYEVNSEICYAHSLNTYLFLLNLLCVVFLLLKNLEMGPQIGRSEAVTA